jgi:hypothetical protein
VSSSQLYLPSLNSIFDCQPRKNRLDRFVVQSVTSVCIRAFDFFKDSCLYFISKLGPRAPNVSMNTMWKEWREITCRPKGRYFCPILTFIRRWIRYIIQNKNDSLLWIVVNGDSRENLFLYLYWDCEITK